MSVSNTSEPNDPAADSATSQIDIAGPSTGRTVQIIGDLPPAPILPKGAATADDSDSDDELTDRANGHDYDEEDPQTEDEAGPSSVAAEPEPANTGITRGVTQYGSVSVENGATVATGPVPDEIPDDSELLANFSDDEEVLDLGHLRLTTTKNLGLQRFANSLKRLCLRQNLITKIRSKDVGTLTKLEDLDLYDNSIEKISGLDKLTELESLDLSFNNIHHISNVSHLGKLQTIYFVQNKISKVRPDDLRGPIAESLSSLELGGNRLRSIENIDHLHNLTQLWLGKNKITSLQGLASLTNLRVLSIQSNRITKLEGLETLVNLEELYISHNGLTKLEGLEKNVKLTTLDVGANMIEKIENIEHLSQLEEFWANDNKIANLNDLDRQLGPNKMPNLETVYLEGNPAQRTEGPAYRRKVKLLLPQLKQIDATRHCHAAWEDEVVRKCGKIHYSTEALGRKCGVRPSHVAFSSSTSERAQERPVCATCLSKHPRLATFCPICENATSVFNKGPRSDVTRAGQVVFDADRALDLSNSDFEPQHDQQDSPPTYTEATNTRSPEESSQVSATAPETRKSDFVIENDDDDDDGGGGGGNTHNPLQQSVSDKPSSSRSNAPQLLRQSSKSKPSAELDVAGTSSLTTTSEPAQHASDASPSRIKVDPHRSQAESATPHSASIRHHDGQTRQYWLRKDDTLQSIAIRFGLSGNVLCMLNSLPRAVLSTSPHLLHTRSFILLPAHAVEKQLASNPDLAKALEGPPQKSAAEKTVAARRAAEARFRALLTRNVASSSRSRTEAETPADEKAARAYVGLAEDELRFVDFGEGCDEHGLPLAYEEDRSTENHTLTRSSKDKVEKDDAMAVAQLDTARNARFEAILTQAVARWEMDTDWERCQRAKGLDPGSISKPIGSTPHISANAAGVPRSGTTSSNSLGSWFTRALTGGTSHQHQPVRRGEFSFARPPSLASIRAASHGEGKSESRPRHVVSLSSSIKLPRVLQHTLTAHKGPVNVARYNSLGRYVLTGGSDRTIRLWNAKTGGEPIKTYALHNYEVHALDIAPDNSRFASGGGDKSVFVWDVPTGTIVRRFSGHAGKINDVRFGGRDGDGSVVVAGGFDGVVRIFDLRAQGAWRPIMELKEAKDSIMSISVSSSQGCVVTGSVDGVVRTYDLRSGELRSDTVDSPIVSVEPSATASTVLVSTLDSTHRLLDLRDGTLLQKYTGHTQQTYRTRATFTNNEDAVIAGDEHGNLFAWDLVSSERLPIGISSLSFRQAEPHHAQHNAKPILWTETNPDTSAPTEFVTAAADGSVKVWGMSDQLRS
ncbi:WD40 repeat-like protein [Testicularia cyperi]|uniref:Leucine-rich repeat and WD repeat-containing protein 1 n=1 Tax=Testicularia cyperi TaxID=1882483 RepID=A0A317XR80_9BASI|nr:WD40 repeat-like protein [Testicularia cyperi]